MGVCLNIPLCVCIRAGPSTIFPSIESSRVLTYEFRAYRVKARVAIFELEFQPIEHRVFFNFNLLHLDWFFSLVIVFRETLDKNGEQLFSHECVASRKMQIQTLIIYYCSHKVQIIRGRLCLERFSQ